MRTRLRHVALAAPLLTLAGVFVTASPAAAAGPVYAALGDSYSSGVGTGNYTSESGSCRRSNQGYPALWASQHAASSFTFVACSGAKTGDVLNNQLGGLSAATTLVTITIGGNDAGFTTVLTNCILGSDSGCKSAVDSAKAFAQNTLPGLLNNVYNQISAHAPNARVVVLGYPRFYQIGGSCIVGLSDTKRGYINGGADTLDSVISTAAGQHANFRFADVRGQFAPHEICSSGSVWLHSLDFAHTDDSYHPFASGYQGGYLPALDGVTG
jgi:lysophospholipase L1-like esterase